MRAGLDRLPADGARDCSHTCSLAQTSVFYDGGRFWRFVNTTFLLILLLAERAPHAVGYTTAGDVILATGLRRDVS